MTYFTADLHLDHKKMAEMRGFTTVEEMNIFIVTNYNDIVKPGDTVFILGDFAWKRHKQWLAKLNGKKVLIRGNHDKMPQDALQQFKEVSLLKELKIEGHIITLCHFPMMSWNGSIHNRLHLYGHCHGTKPEYLTAFDVGVDCWNLKPISLDTVLTKYKYLAARKDTKDAEYTELRYRLKHYFTLLSTKILSICAKIKLFSFINNFYHLKRYKVDNTKFMENKNENTR